jgi:hypothetical protein
LSFAISTKEDAVKKTYWILAFFPALAFGQDRKGSADDGRYLLFEAGDFFADRDVRAVEKIELVRGH